MKSGQNSDFLKRWTFTATVIESKAYVAALILYSIPLCWLPCCGADRSWNISSIGEPKKFCLPRFFGFPGPFWDKICLERFGGILLLVGVVFVRPPGNHSGSMGEKGTNKFVLTVSPYWRPHLGTCSQQKRKGGDPGPSTTMSIVGRETLKTQQFVYGW